MLRVNSTTRLRSPGYLIRQDRHDRRRRKLLVAGQDQVVGEKAHGRRGQVACLAPGNRSTYWLSVNHLFDVVPFDE